MIPYEQRHLAMSVVAYEVPKWSRVACEALLEVAEQNGWNAITQMQASVDDPWRSYDRSQAAIFAMKRGVRLRATTERSLESSLYNGGRSNAIRIDIAAAVFEARPPAAVDEWIARALAAFPDAQLASASGDDDQTTLKLEHDLITMPLFRDIGWLHVLCPSSYPEHYDREVLLAAPCHRVEERANGTIWIWVYEHPLRYDDPGVRDAIVRLNKYLQAHVKD